MFDIFGLDGLSFIDGFPWLSISPLKPIIIISFMTVFGRLGIIGKNKGLNPVVIFIVALLSGFFVSYLLYRFIIVPLYKSQNTSAVTHDKLIGLKAKIISPN